MAVFKTSDLQGGHHVAGFCFRTVTLYSGFPRDQGLTEDTKNMLPGSVIQAQGWAHQKEYHSGKQQEEAMAPDPTKAEWRSVGRCVWH